MKYDVIFIISVFQQYKIPQLILFSKLKKLKNNLDWKNHDIPSFMLNFMLLM